MNRFLQVEHPVAIQIHSLDSTGDLFAVFHSLYAEHQLFCFKGELGAGKTSIIKLLCTELGVVDGLSSPSFGLVNEYTTTSNNTIYHFDLYRLKHPDELIDIGWSDYLNSGCLIFVEWPEMAAHYIPADAVQVEILVDLKSNLRTLTITIPNEH